MNFGYLFRQILPKIVNIAVAQWYRYSSNLSPVRMAVDIFDSPSTNSSIPPLIVMHGYLGSKNNLTTVCKKLEQSTNRKIFCLDARNHGESPHDAAHSMEHIAADISLFVSEERINRMAVLGHSMGGRAMAFFTLTHPDMIEKAVIADISPVSVPPTYRAALKVLENIRNFKIAPNTSMHDARISAQKMLERVAASKQSAAFIVRNLRKSDSGKYYWAINADALITNFEKTFDSKIFQNHQYKGPVLFIFGKRSPFFIEDDWAKIKTLFPAAEKQVLDSGHLVHFEQQAKFVELVANFLKK